MRGLGAWNWCAAWTPAWAWGQDFADHFHAWRVDLARRVDAAWKESPSVWLTLLPSFIVLSAEPLIPYVLLPIVLVMFLKFQNTVASLAAKRVPYVTKGFLGRNLFVAVPSIRTEMFFISSTFTNK